MWMRQDPEDRIAYDLPPQFTASIEAALSLVPALRLARSAIEDYP